MVAPSKQIGAKRPAESATTGLAWAEPPDARRDRCSRASLCRWRKVKLRAVQNAPIGAVRPVEWRHDMAGHLGAP